MKRPTYVDKSGNVVNQSFENKKPLLACFFLFGTVIPLIIIGLIIYTMVQNNTCDKIYKAIEQSALNYLKNREELPEIEGENTIVHIDKLYDGFLRSSQTNDIRCSGTVKVTKYKETYLYTLDVRGCKECSTNIRYGDWSNETSAYPSSHAIIDVIPYYNYYEKEINNTAWSEYYTQDQISDKESKYGVYLPKDEDTLPIVPKEGKIIDIETEDKIQYRYQDLMWNWYDIEGDYSEYSSEMPDGYANKDEQVSVYTDWTDYSQNSPEAKSYREIQSVDGYRYYYEDKNGKKVYYKSGQYVNPEEVDQTKYNMQEPDPAKLYRYRDKQWRWYNGQKRKYSMLYSYAPVGLNLKDEDTATYGSFSSWEDESKVNGSNEIYRSEETRTVTRYREVYEILSLKVLKEPLPLDEFEEKVKMDLPDFAYREDKKLDVTYKFKYRKTA